MMNKQKIEDKFKTQRIVWDARNFGAYTLTMTLSGLFLGMGQWFAILSVLFLGLSLYVYAKNKEDMAFEEAIENKLRGKE